jgi:hypothetical protein
MSGREAFNNDDDVCMPFHATRKMNIFRSAGVLQFEETYCNNNSQMMI